MSSKAGPSRRRDPDSSSSPDISDCQDQGEEQEQEDEDDEARFFTHSQMPIIDKPIDSQDNMWYANEIIDEKPGGFYKVDWFGKNPETNKPWERTWVQKKDATELLLDDWERKKESGFVPPSMNRGRGRGFKRKRASTAKVGSPKRWRSEQSTATEGRGSKTPAAQRTRDLRSSSKASTRQGDDEASYVPKRSSLAASKAKRNQSSSDEEQESESQQESDGEQQVSPIKTPSKRSNLPVVSIPRSRPDKGKGRALPASSVGDGSADESTGDASIVPDSQSQEKALSQQSQSAKEMPPPKKNVRPVPAITAETFRPHLPDSTILPSSGDLRSTPRDPSQAETIQQFTSPARGALSDVEDEEEDDAGLGEQGMDDPHPQDEDENDDTQGDQGMGDPDPHDDETETDSDSGSEPEMKRMVNSDGIEILVPIDYQETQLAPASGDVSSDLADQRAIDSVLDDIEELPIEAAGAAVAVSETVLLSDGNGKGNGKGKEKAGTSADDEEEGNPPAPHAPDEVETLRTQLRDIKRTQAADRSARAMADTVLRDELKECKAEVRLLKSRDDEAKAVQADLEKRLLAARNAREAMAQEGEKALAVRDQREAASKKEFEELKERYAVLDETEKQDLPLQSEADRTELEAVKAERDSLKEERDEALRRKDAIAADERYALTMYQDASTKAVQFAKANKELEAQVKKLQDQLSFGLKQRELFITAFSQRNKQELETLKAQVKILTDQSRLTGDDVRERARRCDDVERRNAQLHGDLEFQEERNDKLSVRNTELARRVDFLLAGQTGAADEEEESDFESEAEASDEEVVGKPPPPQLLFTQPAPAPEPETVAPSSSAHTTVDDMQDDDIEAAVTQQQQNAALLAKESAAQAEPDAKINATFASPASEQSQSQSQPSFANAAANEWWACKWRDSILACPVLCRSRQVRDMLRSTLTLQEFEQHALDHCRGRVDGQGANMVALS